MAAATPTLAGTIANCNTSPALPSGLAISSASCVITGTPSTAQSQSPYSIKATYQGTNTILTVVSLRVSSLSATRVYGQFGGDECCDGEQWRDISKQLVSGGW